MALYPTLAGSPCLVGVLSSPVFLWTDETVWNSGELVCARRLGRLTFGNVEDDLGDAPAEDIPDLDRADAAGENDSVSGVLVRLRKT